MTVTKRKIDPFTARSGWTPSRRRLQAARLRKTRPWLRSTGPRTAAGKARVARNALKSGVYSANMAVLKDALRAQRQFMALIRAHIRACRAYRRSDCDPALKPREIGPLLCLLHDRFMAGVKAYFARESLHPPAFSGL